MLQRTAIYLLFLSTVFAVNRPPNIYVQPTDRDIYYIPGESVEILCIADGIPKPKYIWRRNGVVYNPSGQEDRVVQLPNQGTIVFNKPGDKDEGIFQCFADNGYGISASVKINLRKAKLKKFAYEPRQTHTVYAGNDLTLPCTPPQSYPPAVLYWVTKIPDGRWQAINFDKRVSMDIEGRLRFTNVLRSDMIGGRAYSCFAINFFMRDNAIGPEHVVTVFESTEQKLPAKELWTSPSDQLFLKGGTLRLKCIFAGNPTPEVYWEKLEGTFPDRAKFKSFGQELHITDVRESDAGQYECMGLNSASTEMATKAFNVRIEAAPFWVEEPHDVEASINEKATFICKADGDPKPEYAWYINGVPLEDRQNKLGVRDPRIYNNNRFYKKDANNITLTNLTLEDHMNIQCNASNKHGYIFSDVYLNVLAEKPTIIKPPPAQIKVAESKSVTIDCLVTGKPDPTVTWYRNQSLITGGRFQIMPNGTLHIQKVVMADAGDYRCRAKNIYGEVTSSTCKTQIRRKTRIEQYPLDLEVIAGYDAKFTCSGSTDFDEAAHMEVYWEKDDKRVSANEQRMTQNFQDNSLTISGTIVRDSGVYTCIITNGLDEDRAYAILTVKAEKPTIIKPPPAQIKVAESKSVTLDCLVTGKPDPTVTWYRDQSLITGGRFQIMPNGNLHIQKVVMADAGDYRCRAKNIYGEVTSSTCKTQIRRKTRIEQYPLDLEVIAGYDAKFTCSGSTDFDEAAHMEVYWEKDDKRVSANEQRMTQNFQDNSLTISGTIVRDSGVYTCIITNGLDEDRAYAILTVKGTTDTSNTEAFTANLSLTRAALLVLVLQFILQ
ncbi:neuroglian-like [Ruditapes philippinarum]|uniref:neuroglian-like n=1 Tax=Ruditapes philippinarum TaxID=129788 RepID=UPI00295AD5A3|nr:neuroglian-like [Ruditapes philippinarum]